MAFFQNAYYTCNCEKEKCDRNCLEFRKMTHTESNGDMIRNMTDEELVDIICCQYKECKDLNGECNKCLLDWLKQEVSDGS